MSEGRKEERATERGSRREDEKQKKRGGRDDGLKRNDTILWQRLTKAAIHTDTHTHTKCSKLTHSNKETQTEP